MSVSESNSVQIASWSMMMTMMKIMTMIKTMNDDDDDDINDTVFACIEEFWVQVANQSQSAGNTIPSSRRSPGRV